MDRIKSHHTRLRFFTRLSGLVYSDPPKAAYKLFWRRLRTVDVFDPRANRWESLKTEMVDARSAGQARMARSSFHHGSFFALDDLISCYVVYPDIS